MMDAERGHALKGARCWWADASHLSGASSGAHRSGAVPCALEPDVSREFYENIRDGADYWPGAPLFIPRGDPSIQARRLTVSSRCRATAEGYLRQEYGTPSIAQTFLPLVGQVRWSDSSLEACLEGYAAVLLGKNLYSLSTSGSESPAVGRLGRNQKTGALAFISLRFRREHACQIESSS